MFLWFFPSLLIILFYLIKFFADELSDYVLLLLLCRLYILVHVLFFERFLTILGDPRVLLDLCN